MTDQASGNEIANWNRGDVNYRLSSDESTILFVTNNQNDPLPKKTTSPPFPQTIFAATDLLEGAPVNPVTPVAFANMAAVVAFMKARTGFSGAGGAGQAGFNPDFVFSADGTDANDFAPAEALRDTYFTTNPTELVTGVLVVVVNTFPDPDVAQEQIWDGSAWANTSTVLSPQQISDLLYSLPDRNPLTDARAATVDGITGLGRGQIITAAEATEIDNSYSASSRTDNVITFTQNDTSTETLTLARAMLQYADVNIASSVAITAANLATYSDQTVAITGADVVITLDTIANLAGEYFVTFVNEQSAPATLTPATGENLAGRNNISLNQGQSVTIKRPQSGVVWGVVAGPATTTTTPLRPDPVDPDEIPDDVVRIVRDEMDEIVEFDASSGSFPAGADTGFLYPVSVAGTVDGEPFETHDSLLAIVDEASTTTFAGNWRRLDGDQNVRSWGGLQGTVPDDAIIRKLRTLGFENVATLTNLVLTDIASRIDTGTSLVGDHNITFNITSVRSIATLTMTLNSTLIHTFTTSTLVDGTNTQTFNISTQEWADIVTTPNLTTLPFQLSGTTTEGSTITSNIVNVERRTADQDEFAYYGASATATPTGPEVTGATSVEITTAGQQFDIQTTIPTGQFLFILEPAVNAITEITEQTLNISILARFTRTPNERQLNGENFNLNTLGPATGNPINFRVTLT